MMTKIAALNFSLGRETSEMMGSDLGNGLLLFPLTTFTRIVSMFQSMGGTWPFSPVKPRS